MKQDIAGGKQEQPASTEDDDDPTWCLVDGGECDHDPASGVQLHRAACGEGALHRAACAVAACMGVAHASVATARRVAWVATVLYSANAKRARTATALAHCIYCLHSGRLPPLASVAPIAVAAALW